VIPRGSSTVSRKSTLLGPNFVLVLLVVVVPGVSAVIGTEPGWDADSNASRGAGSSPDSSSWFRLRPFEGPDFAGSSPPSSRYSRRSRPFERVETAGACPSSFLCSPCCGTLEPAEFTEALSLPFPLFGGIACLRTWYRTARQSEFVCSGFVGKIWFAVEICWLPVRLERRPLSRGV